MARGNLMWLGVGTERDCIPWTHGDDLFIHDENPTARRLTDQNIDAMVDHPKYGRIVNMAGDERPVGISQQIGIQKSQDLELCVTPSCSCNV